MPLFNLAGRLLNEFGLVESLNKKSNFTIYGNDFNFKTADLEYFQVLVAKESMC